MSTPPQDTAAWTTAREWNLGDVAEFKLNVRDQDFMHTENQDLIWKHVFDASSINLTVGGLQHRISEWVRESLGYAPTFPGGNILRKCKSEEGIITNFTMLRSMRGRTLWFEVVLYPPSARRDVITPAHTIRV